ncbi:hypothetical protein EMIT0P201_10706 [Pseudomonas chlororaphis]
MAHNKQRNCKFNCYNRERLYRFGSSYFVYRLHLDCSIRT